MSLIAEGERLDDLQRDGLMLIQNPQRFCFGIDAVLLSDFVKVKEGERVLDLGTGNGIIPILLSAKTKAKALTGIDIQAESIDLAQRSVIYNHLEEKVSMLQMDLKKAGDFFAPAFFDVIVSNPPYMLGGQGQTNESEAKRIARHEVCATLDDVLQTAQCLLQDRKGRFYMVHRPQRLTEILRKMHDHRIEPKRLKMVHSYIDREPILILVEGLAGGRSGMVVEAPLILHSMETAR